MQQQDKFLGELNETKCQLVYFSTDLVKDKFGIRQSLIDKVWIFLIISTPPIGSLPRKSGFSLLSLFGLYLYVCSE
jgi:hypothetical protein